MSIRRKLLESIESVVTQPKGILVIHSSFSRIALGSGFTCWDALYSIKKLTKRNWIIALPSFTFSFCKTGQYSHLKSKSETGIFSEWAYKFLGNCIRTHHPIYSYVVVGNDLDLFKNLENKSFSAWGEGSIFAIFEKENAIQIMLGCDWGSCTQIHRYEELQKVPYRYFKEFKGFADYEGEIVPEEAKMFVRDLKINAEVKTSLMTSKIEAGATYNENILFRGKVSSIRTKELRDICMNEIGNNKYVLVKNGIKKRYLQEQLTNANLNSKIRLALLSNTNCENISREIKKQLNELVPDRNFDFYSNLYGQIYSDLSKNNSELYKFNPDISIFILKIEEICPLGKEPNFELLDDYVSQIKNFHKLNSGWIIISRFYYSIKTSSNSEFFRQLKLLNQFNNLLEKELVDLDQILWIDIPSESLNTEQVCDSRLWYAGKYSFSNTFSKKVSNRITSHILAILGKSVRAIVLDLDNTLWSGVVGEDGIDGIYIGGDYPGNCFYDFQKILLDLREQGIALTIASKNNEQLALKAINETRMPISLDKISTYKIGWQNKVESIQSISKELNLGLSSLLFIDDNPLEREQVKTFLPEVKVLELPDDPVEFSNTLLNYPYISNVHNTLEDRNRIKSFIQLKELKKRASNSIDFEEYLKSLKIKVHFSCLSNKNINRASQLCQKTNQFNTTSIRYNKRNLKEIDNSGGKVIVIGYESNIIELENIGLMVFTEDFNHKQNIKLELFLLSCRILGQGLEKLCLEWAINNCHNNNFKKLIGKIIKNERNMPTYSIFKDCNFVFENESTWIFDLKNINYTNSSIKIMDHC